MWRRTIPLIKAAIPTVPLPVRVVQFLTKHGKYAAYLYRHKVAVYRAGRRLGVGRVRLIVHDWSKFLPDEWGPYAEYFNGYPRTQGERRYNRLRFDRAWLRHIHRQPHHPQHWALRQDSGETRVLEMPLHIAREMLADWEGAGVAQGKPGGPSEVKAWYLAGGYTLPLGPNTRAFVENELGLEREQRLSLMYARAEKDRRKLELSTLWTPGQGRGR